MFPRLTIYFALLALLGTGCKAPSTDETQQTQEPFKPSGTLADLVHNPMRADGSIDSSFLPILLWKEPIYDFGTAFEGDIITQEYHFTNIGTAPLLILNASSSCGCTVPEWPQQPVPPDSSASIRVQFNTAGRPGHQSKEVTIFANTLPNQSKITIQGTVNKSN